MGLFRKKKPEIRADNVGMSLEDPLLTALLGRTEVTKATAMQIPTVASSVSLIGDLIAATPIKLYREVNGKTEEIKDDVRLRLLNEDTGDTLDSNQFWHAMVEDYFLGKGGYAYIKKNMGEYVGLHYVDEINVSIVKNEDPIFKDYDIYVYDKQYYPHEFLKILRNSRDGAQGTGIVTENDKLLSAIYNSLLFENNLSKKAGVKKGFLKSTQRLNKEAMEELKSAYNRLYSNGTDEERVVILNEGISFEAASSSAAELQMNENKTTNAEELSKIFHIPIALLSGNATNGVAIEKILSNVAKIAVIPVMKVIETALNRDFLRESEKKSCYFAFDTKELLKGNMKERFEAYAIAIEKNILQVDEVRYMEELPQLGFNFVKLGLNDVLYDPKENTVYTPNTGRKDNLKKGGKTDADFSGRTEG